MQRSILSSPVGTAVPESEPASRAFIRPWQSRHLESILAPAGVLALVLFQLLLSRYALDLIDEGYFVNLADRILAGELPYRDFSTPYTPAIHFLHAWGFSTFGRELLVPRLILIVAKTALVVLLYLLGRRIMPPLFAALPICLLFALDTIPFMWEPHPAWYALLFALAAVWCIARLIDTGSGRWIALAGAAAAVSFAFKQNIGAFALVSAAAFILFCSAELPSTAPRLRLPRILSGSIWMLALRALFATALVAALAWLLRPYLDPRVGTVFLLPLLALAAGGLATWGRRGGGSIEDAESTAARLAVLGAAFAIVTAPWLMVLIMWVGPSHLPLNQFVGALDLTGFYWELAEPRLGFALLLLAGVACPLAIQRLGRSAPFARRIVEAAALMVIAVVAVDLALADPVLATLEIPPYDNVAWRLSMRAAETMLLYLPSLCFWAGAVALVAARRSLGRATVLTVGWYLMAGSLLFFNFYPRMDTMHVTFSAPLLFVLGAFALYRLFRLLDHRSPALGSQHAFRGLLFTSLLAVPLFAALPNGEWRIRAVLSEENGAFRFDAPSYVPLGLPGADVLVHPITRDQIGGVARYLRERTVPGEPIFVYQTVPMFYYLADRPNPTPFGHVYPAAATPREQLEMIETLERRQVRYVVWDQDGANEWAAQGKHILNLTLTDYLLKAYRTETSFGSFHLLVRSE